MNLQAYGYIEDDSLSLGENKNYYKINNIHVNTRISQIIFNFKIDKGILFWAKSELLKKKFISKITNCTKFFAIIFY
jgi:hypothetical protein